MYKDYLKLGPSKLGKGVYTTVTIPANVPIIEFRGDIFSSAELKHPPSKILQIGLDTYLGPSGDLDDYINHSCNPNCTLHIVGNRALLYSKFFISKDIELTFDYSTSSTDSMERWSMQCKCGTANCRKIISGFQYLDNTLQKDYKDKKIVPIYLK